MPTPNKLYPRRHRPKGLEIVYDDRDVLVVDKEAGLLTMSFHKEQSSTAERILTDFVRKGNARSRRRVFVVHRLDRETSGLLVFAKSLPARQRLKDNWKQTEKYYLAVVQGPMDSASGVFSSYLAENKDQFVYSVENPKEGRLAQTAYSVIKQTRQLSIVKIKLLTGQKNQIRVHFAEHGYPVVGDRKYGNQKKAYERLALHAKSLAFTHPHHGERMIFSTVIPDFFKKIANGLEEADWEKTHI